MFRDKIFFFFASGPPWFELRPTASGRSSPNSTKRNLGCSHGSNQSIPPPNQNRIKPPAANLPVKWCGGTKPPNQEAPGLLSYIVGGGPSIWNLSDRSEGNGQGPGSCPSPHPAVTVARAGVPEAPPQPEGILPDLFGELLARHPPRAGRRPHRDVCRPLRRSQAPPTFGAQIWPAAGSDSPHTTPAAIVVADIF